MTAIPLRDGKSKPAAFTLLDTNATDQNVRELRAAGYCIKSPSFHNGRAIFPVVMKAS